MAEPGRTLYNPVNGDRVTFLKTAEETGGEYLLLEIELAPAGSVPLHRHLSFIETLEAGDGELNVNIGGRELVLRPGQRAVVPPNTAHRYSGRSPRPLRFVVEERPAGRIEEALRILYGLAADGRVTSKGLPKNLLEMAWVIRLGDGYLAGLPVPVQIAVFSPLAALARLFGVDRRLQRRYLDAQTADPDQPPWGFSKDADDYDCLGV